jgi:outer membrane protein insertion porin family
MLMTGKKKLTLRMIPPPMSKLAKVSRIFYYLIACSIVSGMVACSNTKYLPAGESLYVGSTIKLEGPKLNKKKRKLLKAELLALTRPKPNSAILGLRIKLFAYNLAGHPKKKHSPAAWLKRKFGESPVLVSDVNLDKNMKVLSSDLENRGYFQDDVKGDTVVKNKRARAVYSVQTNTQYTIKEVHFQADSTELTKSIDSVQSESLLKPGEPFNLEVIKAERLRIDNYLKENGFYYFNPDFLIIKADTNDGDHKVVLYVDVKLGTPGDGKKVYTIKDVYVFTQYSLNAGGSDTNKTNAKFYEGYYVIDKRNIYKPRLFEQALQFSPGDLYNRTDHNQSLNRLINLNLFKFVKNRFEPVAGDSAKLNTFYYLTPLPRQALRFELNGSTKSNNLTGSNISLAWRNRNFFRAGELLTITATGGFEVQYSGQYKGYNTYRGGLDGTLTYPRFLAPFFNLDTRSGFIPKTNILLAYDALNKNKLYTLNSFRGSFGYAWKESPLKEHQFNPISINYVQPWNVTPEYLDSIAKYQSLKRSIDKQFIIGSTYNYNYNQMVGNQPANGIYFNGNLDLSGNIIGLISQANWKTGDSIKIFGARFAQYVKVESDFRYYRKLGDHSVWANRAIVGIGYPYGNSQYIPFIKQFFIGGNNSIRAFRSRALGPGSYAPVERDINDKRSFVAEQSGDIKLELNTEVRAKLFSIVQGAAFVDAGNIWLYNEDTTKPGAKFSKDWYKELAVGAGVGLRFDVSILVLRLDLAFPLRVPYLPDGQRWVLNKIDFANSDWRKQNLVFNLAIGYPF